MKNSKTPLYTQVVEYLKGKIIDGELLPGDQLPTEIELAEKFNVSRITSKRAMEELAREGLIYRKKGQGSFVSSAQKLNNIGKTNKIIAMIIPYQSSREELIDYIKGATDFLNSKKYYLTVHCTDDENAKREREFLINLPLEGFEGIIYYPMNINIDYDILKPMCLNEYPIVTIDKYYESLPINSVVSDNYGGSYNAVSTLIERGHKRIAFLTRTPLDTASSLKERFSAYCKALKDHDISIDHNIIFTNYASRMLNKKTEEARVEYLSGKLQKFVEAGVTTFFTEYDTEILLACKSLLQRGFVFPKEFAIAGFDHIRIPDHFNMSLISIDQNFYEIGAKAAELIIDIIESNEYKYKKTVLPVEVTLNMKE